MALAFWRDKRATVEKRNGSSSRSRASGAPGADANDPTAALRIRARRRLIGAAALLLAAVILVPLLLDPTPRPTVDNIPIDIPSEKTPFTPRLSLPPVPDPGQTPIAPAPDLAPDAEKGKSETGAAKSEPPKADSAKPAETKSKPPPEAKTDNSAKSKGQKIVLQAAALSTDAAAQDLSDRLRKAGFTPFTEKVDTADGVRFRVRVGPYATRDEAQRAQAKLRAIGVSATLVAG